MCCPVCLVCDACFVHFCCFFISGWSIYLTMLFLSQNHVVISQGIVCLLIWTSCCQLSDKTWGWNFLYPVPREDVTFTSAFSPLGFFICVACYKGLTCVTLWLLEDVGISHKYFERFYFYTRQANKFHWSRVCVAISLKVLAISQRTTSLTTTDTPTHRLSARWCFWVQNRRLITMVFLYPQNPGVQRGQSSLFPGSVQPELPVLLLHPLQHPVLPSCRVWGIRTVRK